MKELKNKEDIKQLDDGMQLFVLAAEKFDVHVFANKALSANPNIVNKLKYAIENPSFLMPIYIDMILNGKNSAISKWYLYRSLTIPEYKDLVTNFSEQQQWGKIYRFAIVRIKQKLDIPILSIVKRKELIKSLFYNCNKQFYGSSLIIVFPLIEGIMWDLAKQINMQEKIFGDKEKELFDDEKKETFSSERTRDVIERTAINKYLDSDFIREFCDELYEERNPVLHGNMECQYECRNITVCLIKKILVLDHASLYSRATAIPHTISTSASPPKKYSIL